MIRALRSSSFRLALAVSLSFLCAFVLLGAGVYLAVSTLLENDAREVVRAEGSDLLEVYQQSGHQALLDQIRSLVEQPDDPDAVYALLSADGQVVAGTFATVPVHAPQTRWLVFRERNDDDNPRVIALLQPLGNGEILLTGLRARAEDGFLAVTLRSALAGLLAAAVLGVLIGWLISRWVSRRLRGLDDTAARVGAGELALRVRSDGSNDAFDRLAVRFNAMLDRIQELLDGVRHATDHIAHDLRTPLTRLRNRLDGMRDAGLGGSGIDAAIADTDQLLHSFGALLRLSRIEAQSPPLDAPRIDLQALSRDALELYQPVAMQRGIVLEDDTMSVSASGDADQLFQALVNLLDNAIKYAPENSRVRMGLRQTATNVLLEVADAGPGIAPRDRARVFDRFERVEDHRGTPGTGLGLSLVRAIVQRHAGTIELDDNAPGLIVRIRLPQGTARH